MTPRALALVLAVPLAACATGDGYMPLQNYTPLRDGTKPSREVVFESHSEVVIHEDRGGRILEYETRLRQIGQKPVRIMGTCSSSCTILLAAPDVCVADDARIGFHRPSSRTRGHDPEHIRKTARRIARNYPPALAERFLDDWSHHKTMTWLTAAELRALAPNVKRCANGGRHD